MSIEEQTVPPPTRRRLAWITGSGFVAATLVIFLFVLPVEFRVDPTGFGRLVGLNALAAATPWNEVPVPTGDGALARFYPEGYRTDVIDVPIPGNDGDLEYKLEMKAGDTIVYSWEVLSISNPDWFYTEFHGHTEPAPGEAGTVTFYQRETGAKASGSLIAPFDGVHGWYWQNQSEDPIVVRLRVAGFYEIVPDQVGEPVTQ